MFDVLLEKLDYPDSSPWLEEALLVFLKEHPDIKVELREAAARFRQCVSLVALELCAEIGAWRDDWSNLKALGGYLAR